MTRDEFLAIYHGSPHVRRLFAEQFETADYVIGAGRALVDLGWSAGFPVHVIPYGSNPYLPTYRNQVSTLGQFLDLGLELFRPIRERHDRALLITWDLEYYNVADPYWLYRDGGRNQRTVFAWMAPVYDELFRILDEFGVRYLVDVTASGIHVWSAVDTGSPVFREMAKEGFLEDSLAAKYRQTPAGDIKRHTPVPPAIGRAYNAAGKMLEFLTHLLAHRAQRMTPLPITVSDTAQGGSSFHNSGLSSDLTQYAHPLYMRVLRVVGSSHQKVCKAFPDAHPAADILKTPDLAWGDVLDLMWDPYAASEYYAGKSAAIPLSNAGWGNVLKTYRRSALRKWHREFEAGVSAPGAFRFRLSDHPPCVQQNLYHQAPRDALLAPTNLQLIAEYMDRRGENLPLLARGIADTYENPKYGWFDPVAHTGIDWTKYDAHQAADFWMRVYMGLSRAGLGRGLDCGRVQGAGICPIPRCGIDLRGL